MCLIAWSWQPESATPLILLSNRDEFYQRPALPLHWWEPGPGGNAVLAGRDLQAGGTWLGVSRTGRLAALTNYRTPVPARDDTPSRGELVTGFLQGNMSAPDYLQALSHRAPDYNPFNLLVFDGQRLLGLESRQARVVTLAPGVGAVSNADFHTPWPKLVQLQQQLDRHLRANATDDDGLLAQLQDTTTAPDAHLPQTGIPLELERALSSIFIATPAYGTRASSLVKIQDGRVSFTEQRFDAGGFVATSRQSFDLESGHSPST